MFCPLPRIALWYAYRLIKGLDAYTPHLQGNQNSSGLQVYEVPYWPALAVGGAAQLAAADCPN